MQERIDHHDQNWQLNCGTLELVDLHLRRWSVNRLRLVISREGLRPLRLSLAVCLSVFNETSLRSLNKILKFCELFNVPDYSTLLVLVDRLHGRVQKPSHKPRHVLDRAINQKLFYDSLARESLTQPQTESHVLFKRVADNLHEGRDLAAGLASDRHSQHESSDELVNHN